MFQALSDQDSGYGEMCDPPVSLWRLVEDQVPPSERAEIRRILGEAAVDLSLDLHAEVEVLLDLCREMRLAGSSSPQRPASCCSVLADPPVIKEMVTQEIRMLLLSVRSKARRQGLDEDQALSKYSPKVVTYVMGAGRPESRARSTDSRWGRPMSGCRVGDERPLSSLSSGSSIEDDVEDLKDKLKISDIDEIVRHLQSLLEEESRSLRKDISSLQRLLEEDFLYIREIQTPLPEPSLTELKEERRIIERDLQLDQQIVTSVQSPSKSNPYRSLDTNRDILGDSSSEFPPYQMTPSSTNPSLRTKPESCCPPLQGSSVKSPDRIPSAGPDRISDPPHKPPHPPGRVRLHSPLHPPGRNPRPSPCVPAERSQSTHGVQPPGAVYVPAPPPAHRPPGAATSVPAFRRVRAKLPDVPP
ncbi:coiled-coil domain-containing protein 24 [Mantella aurantiaca]